MEMTKKELLRAWIIDTLDNTDKQSFNHSIGVVDGMERVFNHLLGGNSDSDKDIQAAYSRMDKRLYPNQD